MLVMFLKRCRVTIVADIGWRIQVKGYQIKPLSPFPVLNFRSGVEGTTPTNIALYFKDQIHSLFL